MLDLLRRSLVAKSYWLWRNGRPTNLGAAIDMMSSADINTLVQLERRLQPLGLWGFIRTMKTVWSTSSLGIDFDGGGSMQSSLPKGTFCKDTAVGESYHPGKSCWREMVPEGTAGLHVCMPGEVHIDPHQAVAGKTTGWGFGGDWGIQLVEDVCSYSLMAFIDHMKDVEGGRPVNVFTRRGQMYGRIDAERERIKGLLPRDPALSAHNATLDSLRQRLDALGTIMQGWAIRGFEGDDGSAEAKKVLDELDAIDNELMKVREALTNAESSGLPEPSLMPM